MVVTIAIVAGVGALMFLAVRKLVRDRKAGNYGCGGSCSGCAGCGHSQQDDHPNESRL